MMFHVVLKKDEDGWIVAECPALPGCFSQGKTEQEALTNIKEAITAWLWAEDLKAAESASGGRSPACSCCVSILLSSLFSTFCELFPQILHLNLCIRLNV